MINQRRCRINFYKSNEADPPFINKEMTKIGDLVLEVEKENDDVVDRDDSKIEVTLKFGGTFIDASAKHLKSGKSVNTTMNLD